MSSAVARSLALAAGGIVTGLGLVLVLFGSDLRQHWSSSPRAALPLAEPGTPPGAGEHPGAGTDAGTKAPAPEGAAHSGQPETPADRASSPPRFDVVRVEPNGEAVVAGRAAPNTTVELLVDGRPVARTSADADGQFALVPPALPQGNSEVSLRATGPDGRAVASSQSVAVALSGTAKPLVALAAPDAPTVVLSRPEASPPAAPQARALRIVSVDAQAGGRLDVTGEAPAGAAVRLYLNDTLVAPARAGPDGRVVLTIGRGVRPGAYRLRLDAVDPKTGAVQQRAEAPFSVPETAARAAARPGPASPALALPAPAGSALGSTQVGAQLGAQAGTAIGAGAQAAAGTRETAAAAPPGVVPALPAPDAAAPTASAGVFVPEITTAKISRGNSLWQISRRVYGRGNRYTVIYDANQEQIRDPNRIYPGQIFVLPEDKGGRGRG